MRVNWPRRNGHATTVPVRAPGTARHRLRGPDAALTVFIRAVFTWLRRAAHEDGIDPEAIVEPGAVSLIQRFGKGCS